MTQRRKFGRHYFRKVQTFTSLLNAEDYIENARSYGEQVRKVKTSRGYEIWERIGEYKI